MRDHELGTSTSEFLWAVGIENTFIPQTRAGHRRFDEYELMGHYRCWRHDIDLAADLGITAIRYGVPWYRVNPKPGVFDWSWTDAVLEHLVVGKGLTPIVDLMHYGTPLWLDNQFVNASYPQRVAEYAGRFAEKYASLVGHYTPLNEPAVTAAFCGRDGLWPPYLRGDDGYVKVLISLVRGICMTAKALRAVRPDTVLVHVEDVGFEVAGHADLVPVAAAAQQRRLLPLDLVCGRVLPGHPAFPWLLEQGATESELLELAASVPHWDVLGVNFYPWTNRRLVRTRTNRLRLVADSPAPALAGILRLVHERYGLPVMVTETSSPGTQLERAAWLEGTLNAVRLVREQGIPVVGYTWFPLFTMIEWKYRWSRKGLMNHLLHLGLYDVHPQQDRMDREPTALVAAYRQFIADPSSSIGEAQRALPITAGLVA